MDSPFPEAFEMQIKDRLKDEFDTFKEEHLDKPPVSIRINPFKKNEIKNIEETVPWSSFGYYLSERPVFTLDPLFHAGAYYVQEASSMFLEQAFKQHIDSTSDLTILDLSAAPGGKSTHLISLMNQKSLLVANEVIRTRANVLSENIQKWGTDNVVVTNNDPVDFQRLPGFFDVIIVDAPCSGEGMFRKDPQAIQEWSPENVALCSSRQKRILQDVWPALKENGILIYSTCTYNEFENEQNLLWLQQEKKVDFLRINLNPAWNVEEITDGLFGYRFYPHRVKGEGFFIAAIQKKEPSWPERNQKNKVAFNKPSNTIINAAQSWITNADEKFFIQRDDLIQFIPDNKKEEIEILAKQLRLIYAGTFMATRKHDKLIPEHALALSVHLNHTNFPSLPLSYDHALQYLRKETFNVDAQFKGFALMTYNNLPLGWVNMLASRFNNLYPSDWRIRMNIN